MTQKELRQALEFSQSIADIHIAQYESGARVAKAQPLDRIVSVLEVNPIILSVETPEMEEE